MKAKGQLLGLGVILAAVLLFLGGCAGRQAGIESGSDLYRRVPRLHHETEFPAGHKTGTGRHCYYDQKADVYYCQF